MRGTLQEEARRPPSSHKIMLYRVSLLKQISMDAISVFNYHYDFRSENPKEDVTTKIHRIPEVHILLTKDIKDTTELG